MKLKTVRNLSCAALFGLLLVPGASAQERNPRITLFGGGSFLQGDRLFVVDGDRFASEFVPGGKLGVRGTVDLNDHWSLEGTYSFGRNNLRLIDLDETPPEERGFGVRLHQFTGNLLLFFTGRDHRVRPFATGGVGWSRFSPTEDAKRRAFAQEFLDDPARLGSTNKFAFNFGGGVEGRVHNRVGVRFDVRDHVTSIPRFGLPERPAGPGGVFFPVNGSVHDFEVSAGIVIYLTK